jgi:hypothetical protein
MKKVIVLDNLTETFNGPIVRSGLQKSSKLDARAFHKMGYDTTFIYCGVLEDHYSYKKICANHIGAKENAMLDNKHMRSSGNYVKKYLNNIKFHLQDADYIIAHCHSMGMMTGINGLVKNKKILFIFHDIIDLMWAYGFCGSIKALKNSDRNYVYIATNSQYSIDRLNHIYNRAFHKKDPKQDLYSGDYVFDGFIKHFVWTDETPSIEDIENKTNESCIIGRYEPAKFHHKLYKYKNNNNIVVHYGIKDIRRDEGLKYYNNLKASANAYREDLSDEDLWSKVKTSQSIILPCWHEGFGFTAFEAGIFGVVPVIFTKEKSCAAIPHQHATVEYLKRANVLHFVADFNDQNSINEAIEKSLKVTVDQRKKISENLLSYFSLENYVNERIDLMNNAKKNTIHNNLSVFF